MSKSVRTRNLLITIVVVFLIGYFVPVLALVFNCLALALVIALVVDRVRSKH